MTQTETDSPGRSVPEDSDSLQLAPPDLASGEVDDLGLDGVVDAVAESVVGPNSLRRRVLGALAIGVVASACQSSEDGLGTATPSSSAPSGTTPLSTAGNVARPNLNLATASGPELELVVLPVSNGSATGAPVASKPSVTPTTAVANGVGSETKPKEPTSASGSSTTMTSSKTPAPSKPEALDVEVPAATGSTVAQTGSATAEPTPAPKTVTPSPLAVADVLLANRVTFGVTPQVRADIQRLGGGGFIDDQLNRTGPDPEAEKRLGSMNLLRLNRKAVYEALRKGNRRRLSEELTHSNLLRATYSKHQLFEMMCHLWMDHFNVGISDDNRIMHLQVDFQENVIRKHALGSFRDLLRATAESPAMLAYLDNDGSNANSEQGINENYGRELLELHTLGIDEGGNHIYNEADVRNASLAMSGRSIVNGRKTADYSDFVFRDDYHHVGAISILNGDWTRGATQGKATGDSLVDYLAAHPRTARHIAYKICRRFVSDSPPSSLVDSTAAVYLQNDTQLVPTVKHVLRSSEFSSSAGQKIRRPFELVVASLRALNVELANDPSGKGARYLRNTLLGMDHVPWSWPQPDGFPDMAADWLTTDGLSNRWAFAARLARNRVPQATVDYRSFKISSGSASQLIETLSDRFGLGAPSVEVMGAIATAARLDPKADANSVDEQKLGDIVALLLSHPIFQTR